jgi:hypothetical protein
MAMAGAAMPELAGLKADVHPANRSTSELAECTADDMGPCSPPHTSLKQAAHKARLRAGTF